MTIEQRLAVVAEALSSDPRQACAQARRAGFAGLLFDATSRELDITALSTSGRREFRHLLDSHNQSLVALRFDPPPRGLAPGTDVDHLLKRLDRVLESSAGLLAGCVCIDLGPLPVPVRKVQPKPRITPEQAGLIILPEARSAEHVEPDSPALPPDPQLTAHTNQVLGELCALADRYRVNVAVSSSLASFAAITQALDVVRCPWFGIDLDPVAILRDESELDEVFSSVGPLIRHVRARDAVVGADRRTRPTAVGQGAVDWRKLLGSLDEGGYHGMITIDPMELPDRLGAAIAGRSFLITELAHPSPGNS